MNFLGELAENFHHSTNAAHEKGDRIIELLEGIAGGIAALTETVTADSDRDEYHPLSFQATTDATGRSVTEVQRRPGFVSELISLTVVGGAANGGVLVYLNSESPENLLYAGTLSAFFSDGFPEGSVVPDGSKIVVVTAAAGNAANLTVTLRSKRKMLDRSAVRNIEHV